MSTNPLVAYELWLTTGEDDWLAATLIGVHEDGQTMVVAAREFAAPVAQSAVARWFQGHIDLRECNVLVLR